MKELTVIVKSLDVRRDLVKDFWWHALAVLEKEGLPTEIPGLDDSPRFHVRWTSGHDSRGSYIELLRINVVASRTSLQQALEAALVSNNCFGIINCIWEDRTFTQSVRFLTFLQACSVLRIKQDIYHPRDLSGWEGPTHEQCPKCREAYVEMRKSKQIWSAALSPWFDHLDTIALANTDACDNRYEYAHWFGHIVSNRFY